MSPTPRFSDLFGLFAKLSDFPDIQTISQDEMPDLYRHLLAHSNHMTVTLDIFYGETIEVDVLARLHDKNHYARKILLRLPVSKRVVQFGVVQIKMDELPEIAQSAILQAQKPLGRVLIEHNILTHVQPVSYLRIKANAIFSRWFNVSTGAELYGRIGVIYTKSHPAIEVLEVLAPVDIVK